jgi:hypothetical protein
MEAAFVKPMNLEEEDNDILQIPDEGSLPEINKALYDEIDTLEQEIYTLKKLLYTEIVSKDINHTSQDMSPMTTFHSFFLFCISYFIGLLDGQPVPEPMLQNYSKKIRTTFDTVKDRILSTAKESSDARTLVYSLLFRFSTGHPFQLQVKKVED